VSAAAAGKGRIRWLRILAGIGVIVFVALPCLLGAIVLAIGGNYQLRSNAVTEGRAPGQLRFDAERERYVIALSAKPDGTLFDGLSRTERRAKYRVHDSDANEARCTITHPDESTESVRGDRQNVRESVGNVYITVGEFDGRGGATKVDCRFDPPKDLLGTPTETPLMVHKANSTLRYLTWGLFVGVFAFAGLGTLLILWGTVWRGRAPKPAPRT
jgi:hypothetical protein